jgi:hypothetical protein
MASGQHNGLKTDLNRSRDEAIAIAGQRRVPTVQIRFQKSTLSEVQSAAAQCGFLKKGWFQNFK